MTTNAVKRHAQRAVAAGAVGAATLGAFLLPAAPASAQPVTIPGVGTFDVPNEIPVPPALPGLELPGPAPLPFAAPKSSGEIALDAAMSKVGSPYVYGAAGPNSFDCSGLVQWSYRQAGVELPRTSFEQSHVGAPVAYHDLQPGDIVITNGGGHVGIYAGDNKLLNAVQSGTPVSYTTLRPDMVVTARRIV
jgi:peptidoglycan DL-endopeptidase CwlO